MITIIGAGPVGNYVGYKLSEKGEEVRVVEEHKEIGKPVQCTGIFTNELAKIIKIEKKFFVNKIKRAQIYSTKKNFVEFKLRKENIVLDRAKLDFHLHELAASNGVKYILGKRYENNKGNKIKIRNEIVKSDYIIGADGPFSSVAKNNGMLSNRKFGIGSQARMKGEYEKDLVEFFTGIGCFGWVVPENEELARVGVVSYGNPNKDLDKLLDLRGKKGKIIDKQGGFIPIYNPRQQIKKDNVMLVGDAATQVKATTFGGLVPGMLAADAMVSNFEDYPREFKKKVHKDLYYNLLIRKIMDKFKEKEYDDLIKMFHNNKLRKILEEKDRDFPSKFILQMLIREPRLLKYSKKLII